MSALFDFPSLLVVILLFICTMTFARSLYPTIFDSAIDPNAAAAVANSNTFGGSSPHALKHTGIKGICWKASRIGERISPYIAASCLIMAFHILFIKT
jgi:hypothetical protein